MSFVFGRGVGGALCACAVVGVASGLAQADPVHISYEFDQGTGDGFAFSVLHTPTNDRGNGSVLYRIVGTFEIIFDDVANTIEFMEFQADIVNRMNAGIKYGELSLSANSTLDLIAGPDGANDFLIGANQNDQSGNGLLSVMLTDTSGAISNVFEGNRNFLYLNRAYNARANHFNSASYSLGLWGATEEVFGGDGHGGNTNIQSGSLGMDIFGEVVGIVAIPLPTPAGLGALGLIGVAGFTRRRTS